MRSPPAMGSSIPPSTSTRDWRSISSSSEPEGEHTMSGFAMSTFTLWRLATAAALVTLAALGSANAQTYPTKSINLVVPLAAGTGMDTIARLYGDQLSHTLGKPVVIDNRPGAAMMLALTSVARAAPDGYTLGIATSGPLATN